MAVTSYTSASITTPYLTALAQATKLAFCSNITDPTAWDMAAVTASKLIEFTVAITPGGIGGAYSLVTSGGYPALRVAEQTMVNASAAGTGRCLVMHDGTSVLRVIPMNDYVIAAGSIIRIPTFDLIIK